MIRTLFTVAVAVAVEYAIADVTWQWSLIILSILQLIICIGVCMAIEMKAGYYECPECGHRYVPEFKSCFWATHMGWTRKMVCPKCGA